ncbi:hypothetical protein ACMDCT_05870 [Halomonadaceae bacterium KBTZ08]
MMTDPENPEARTTHQDGATKRHEARRYQVSTNRGQARHHVRYVESGGAVEELGSGECDLCRALPVR